MPPSRTKPLDRFLLKIEKRSNGCWIWTGHINRDGYGRFWDGDRQVLAHRWYFQELHGPIALELDHTCHTPECISPCEHRACVNPAHLEPVEHGENVRRGKHNGRKTHCPRGHPYNTENTYYGKDRTHRMCRACHAIDAKERRQRAKEG